MLTRPELDRLRKVSTLVKLLRARARDQPEQRIYTYLVDGETEGGHLTLATLDERACAIAALLQSQAARGDRALLLYPAGLEFISGFYGCLYAGIIAVPLPLPNMIRPQHTLTRLRTIAGDATPKLILTTSSILTKLDVLFTQAPELQTMHWLATDTAPTAAASAWRDPVATHDTLALLQYTSGSTSAPRGVMVTHGNLLANSAHIERAFEITSDVVSVTWLPVFHDMGLTNGILQPVYEGRHCILMPPQSFLQRPARWLQAVSRYKATISGGPNFAYELCIRRVTLEQRSELDLSNWKVAYNGAEPVRAHTIKRFSAAFGACGFAPKSFYPCYGLAEATLIVSGGVVDDEPILCTTQTAALEHNGIIEASTQQSNVRTFVGCGHAISEIKLLIVDPDSLTVCANGEVGEIWCSGPSITQGYWGRPPESDRTFDCYLADTGEGPFLRTGDLGFLRDHELFVTGRLKDLIVIDGRNLYPHDIELTVEQGHPMIRPGCCAAFAVDVDTEERLIIAAEVERHYRPHPYQPIGASRDEPHTPEWTSQSKVNLDTLVKSIRSAVAEEHDVRVHAVVLLRAGGIPKTPSGKVQRGVSGARFLDGTLSALLNE